MQIFTEASKLVEAVEALVVGETDPSYLKRLASWLPTKFLSMGIWEIIKKNFAFVLCRDLFFAFFAYLILVPSITSDKVILFVIFLILIFLISLFTFAMAVAMPSKYGDSGVRIDDVAAVVKHLDSFKTEKEIELLKKSVKLFEDQTRSRVTALKWVVGLIWGGFIYTFSKVVGPNGTESSSWLIIWLGAVTIACLCVWGYEAAVDKLFRTIEFGCNDLCHQLETPKENENPVIS
jgi:hypothetical protein